ncbi:FmdB family zinc ribbon protein [Salinisphaera sp. LB1]|uniref:FmdB family zinc ribbon protein n=1 Tax=Salinisphaera sp. LB1 TaxID=2183911 RepID=UPI000D70841C|nr:zinc ribbon domain-containing protein [Salinisphaera sp. LB1]AWN17897.1 Glycerate kinase [Salinisphaera sp. LB1]
MPIYEYVCTNCGEPLEKLQKLSDAPLTDCPACGQAALKRKVSAAGFRLAGGGWYETDFKSDNRRNVTGDGAASKSSSDGESSGGGASSGGESKSADAGSKASGESKSATPAPKSSSAGSD